MSPSKTIEARQVVMSQDKGDKLDGYNCNGRYWIFYDVRDVALLFIIEMMAMLFARKLIKSHVTMLIKLVCFYIVITGFANQAMQANSRPLFQKSLAAMRPSKQSEENSPGKLFRVRLVTILYFCK